MFLISIGWKIFVPSQVKFLSPQIIIQDYNLFFSCANSNEIPLDQILVGQKLSADIHDFLEKV